MLWSLWRAPVGHRAHYDQEVEKAADPNLGGAWRNVVWIGAPLAGYTLAISAFFVVFLRIRARCWWRIRCTSTRPAGVGGIVLLAKLLVLDFPGVLLR